VPQVTCDLRANLGATRTMLNIPSARGLLPYLTGKVGGWVGGEAAHLTMRGGCWWPPISTRHTQARGGLVPVSVPKLHS
jgi:hypothetical protein